MGGTITADLCVLGAGSAGLSVAAGAAQMGARSVLIEAHKMGGDCLNTGCVPSKSLLAAAKAAFALRSAAAFGVGECEPAVDFRAVHAHVHSTIAAIAPHDSEERFRALGCTVIRERASFLDERTVAAGTTRIRARRFVVATGSRPAVPPVPGMDGVPILTNETIFDLADLPRHLLIIGGGPIGCEMAQAFRRLGAAVTLIHRRHILPKDDPDAATVVRTSLVGDGVTVIEGARTVGAASGAGGIGLTLEKEGRQWLVTGSHLLVAAGRQPNVDGLGLEAAGVRFGPQGIETDPRLRTTNPRIFAAGDVAGGPQFTHIAGYHASIIIRNALFRLPAKVDYRSLPWVTYTDPELAQVGLTEAEARARHGDGIRVLTASFADNDRARAERHSEGFAKAITDKRGRILGATIVGPQAGELIQTWGLAISGGLKIGAIAGMIASYPTLGEISKRVAGSFYTPTLFSPRTRWLVRLLGRLG
ncbi:MAG: FAD-dependent oxidoreductase [Magnetospirillum sp.]|nr:FAD-dependent oxidoreductase [Magnetospirillum sp.]